MMNKMHTAKVHLMKLLFVLPLIAILLLAFRNRLPENIQNPNELAIKQDTLPVSESSSAKARFLNNVTSMQSTNNQVTVTLKDGTKEQYNLDKPDQRVLFEEKYGRMPSPPSPPKVVAPVPAVVPDVSKPTDKSFEKKYPPVAPAPPACPHPPLKPARKTTAAREPMLKVDAVEPVIAEAESIILVSDRVYAATVENSAYTIKSEELITEIEELITEINNQTTTKQLAALRKEMLLKGYRLSLTSLAHTNGTVQCIEGTLTGVDEQTRFVAQKFSKIIIKKVAYENGKNELSTIVLNGLVKFYPVN